MASQDESSGGFSLGKSSSSEGDPEKGTAEGGGLPLLASRRPNPSFNRSSTLAEGVIEDDRILCTSERKALAFQKAKRIPSEDPGWTDGGRKEPLRVLRSLNPRRSAKIIIKGE